MKFDFNQQLGGRVDSSDQAGWLLDFLAYPDADIYELTDGKIYKSNYENTEHHSITKDFLSNYKHFLETLLVE